ncbi:hypothetical protein KOR42_45010 [Thalassoglobus neptunius]|uniref:beta-fructofuranosidase n=1 Tax=Thalassoglobus neptunius TaxID=1938619 RepID=A0A5C5VYI6_9PLAN|nr:glycosyl hydrolase [Thalassoglobus neptunius]TWT43095.1 hypothetical protein KOR42_45010 [Thalassoglobus neptunius]
MYGEDVSYQKTMGDIDIVYHDGVYHLFHLVLPNHDFIAHAVSEDALNWERIENALFIGHPGSWDDHMLWTMHVTPDPWNPGMWRMFYTGLARKDHANIQRVGIAQSRDLIHWEKLSDNWFQEHRDGCESMQPMITAPYDPDGPCPIEAAGPHYESSLKEGRHWVSFRDPFFYTDGKRNLLLMAARIPDGPVIRRGCVGLYEEVAENQFVPRPALHVPGLYDDVEVPNLFSLNDRYYLVGSIREDAKIRYWHSRSPDGPWSNYFDNVLLAKGNYAGRISFDDNGPLVWSFYTQNDVRTVSNLMPPPKRLSVNGDGRLRVRSFEGFDQLVKSTVELNGLLPVSYLVPSTECESNANREEQRLSLSTVGGFQGFLFSQYVECFRFSGRLKLDGLGKCGILFRTNAESFSGYHLSLDLLKGVAQLRAWGERPGGSTEHAFRFKSLQSAFWKSDGRTEWEFSLLNVRHYIELSINGNVLLSLSDKTYRRGQIGCYVESACLRLEDLLLEHLDSPPDPLEQLTTS